MKNIVISFCLFAVHQSFLIDRAGRKKLMGYGYLLMGITMCSYRHVVNQGKYIQHISSSSVVC